jgi:hypothetical protein
MILQGQLYKKHFRICLQYEFEFRIHLKGNYNVYINLNNGKSLCVRFERKSSDTKFQQNPMHRSRNLAKVRNLLKFLIAKCRFKSVNEFFLLKHKNSHLMYQ